MSRATLVETFVPTSPRGVVLLLHGGGSRRAGVAVSPSQLSVLRMIPIAGRCVRAGRRRLAVLRLLNSTRGWDTEHTPADDADWALRRIRERWGPLPVSLVGHSLGGRAALLAGGAPDVRSVCALAPWVYPDDVDPRLAGRTVLFVHGDRDRIARPTRSRALADRLAAVTDVGYVTVRGGTHAMLRRRDVFDGLAASFAVATLGIADATGTVARVLAGEHRLTV